MIKRFENTKLYNPIRSHISVGFSTVKEYAEKIDVIARNLVENRFDGSKSRVLIFVSIKKHAEDSVLKLSEALKNLNVDYHDKIDFYHGGLESMEREERTESFKKGETLILIATKAFGMGMDIPNVHFVYHLDPSSNFEDFLQEVGRAGRNKDAYLSAGFSEDNPIKTNCIIANDDFKKAKDKLHDNQITWSDLIQVQKTVFEYAEKYTDKELSPIDAFALPTDLLSQFTEYDENKCDETFFRVVLYWLEKLQRIKMGTYVPTHLPIRILNDGLNFSKVNNKEDVEKVKRLNEKFESNKDENGFVMISMDALKEIFQVETFSEVWRLLFIAQKAGVIRLEREITIEPTKTRKGELDKWYGNKFSLTIETTFGLAQGLMDNSKYNQQTHFDGEEIDEIVKYPLSEFINPGRVFWREIIPKTNKERSKENIAELLRADFTRKRAKFAFKLIEFLPKAKQKSLLKTELGYSKPTVSQLIFNGYKNSEEWQIYLSTFKSDLYNLISHVNKHFLEKNKRKFNVVDLILSLNIEDKGEKYFKELLFIAKGLGYLKGNAGGLVPMGVELFILDKNILPSEGLTEFETKVRDEFEESNRMKELRLLALECLTKIEGTAQQDEFIKEYFKCSNLSELVRLLEEYFGENHEILSAFRAEALSKAVESLNEDQRKVYNAPKEHNLLVTAGPGSGKTHTLTLRVARLIQEEKIKPDEILVLAYNRAVVVELKDRLNRLFHELGYAKLTKRLKVFTFHGFCKYSLGEDLEDVGFDKWTPRFLEIANTTPGKISQKLGAIKYVFVDEFQDITMNRLELLKFIAHPKRTKICVIGDPNQSIYGYDRVNEGGERSPKPYYEEFEKLYKPKNHHLSINYRSYIQILEKANELLSLNRDKFPMPPMVAHNKYEGNDTICEFYDFERDKTNWKEKLIELVNYINEKGKPYTSIAVMFRSNKEVYKAFNDIRKLNLPQIRIRVQGTKGNLFSTREFHFFLEKIKIKFDVTLSLNYFEELKLEKSALLVENKNWDEYLVNVFLCIAYEFKKEQDEDSTYRDLYEFIKDISFKDDGQFGKIYQQNIYDVTQEKPKREIVLTTMHKVKGIEYDAVLIPPSFCDLPQKIERNFEDEIIVPSDLEDIFEEERRLYYVAYTRAKRKLTVIKWKRENTLDSSYPAICEVLTKEQVEKSLGLLLNEGIEKFTLFWGASDYGRGSFDVIKNQIKIGDEIQLKKRTVNAQAGFDFNVWEVFFNNLRIAQLSSNIPKKMNELSLLEGYVVSSIYAHTYEETINSESGSQYANKWNDESKKRGYIYLIDFSGYGKIIN
jgi:ATP-dependent DNA helicase RecQ